MSEQNNNKSSSKIVLVIIGILFIVGGVSPYLFSYFFSEELSFQDELHGEAEFENEAIIIQTPESEVESSSAPTSTKKTKKSKIISVASETPSSENKKDTPSLPALYESDPFFLDNVPASDTLFVSLGIIRNIVVFIDNFSRGDLLLKFSPVTPPLGNFAITKESNTTYISKSSYSRYDNYADAVAAIDADTFIDLYTLFTPLFDEAYQEIGYPAGSFTPTLEKAITHVLNTPVIHYQIAVSSSSVMYQYADEMLEALPDTQKLMLRMGPNNLQKIKIKLEEIQDELQHL